MPTSRRGALRRLARTTIATVAALAAVTGTAFAASSAETGVDVSRWQHGASLDWAAAKADGVDFAFIKATEDDNYTNPYFASDWSATKSVGLYHGAYHFARPSAGSAAQQARYFVAHSGKTPRARGVLPPVLDLEAYGGLGVRALRHWTATWLRTVEDLTGRTPIIYTGPYFWEHYLGDSTAFTRYPLWIAHYGVKSPRVPGGWPRWTFWQGTSTGRVNGISGNVDMNRFNGTRAGLAALANIPPAQPPTDPTPTDPTPTDPGPTQPGPTDPAPTEPMPQPAPKVATTTSLDLGRSSVYEGRSVSMSGDVATATGETLPGRAVEVYRRVQGATSWTRLTSLRADSAGHYAATFPVSRPASFRATFPGGTRYARSTSKQRTVTLRAKHDPTVDLDAERSAVSRGRSVKLFGHLTTASGSALTDRRVDLYQRAAGSTRWTHVGYGTSLAPTGWYQAYVRPGTDTTYKAVFAGSVRYNAATSNRVTVAVR